MKKMKFGMEQPKVLGIHKSHHEDAETKRRNVKIRQKMQNQLNKQIATSPLLVGVAPACLELSAAAVVGYLEASGLRELTKRQIFFTPVDFSDPRCLDYVFPLNLLLVVTTGTPRLPEAYEHLHQLMKLQTKLIFWQVPFDDILQFQLKQVVTVVGLSRMHNGVLKGSLFDLKGLASIFNSVKGDFRAAWMKPRGVGKVLEAEQLDAETFGLKILFQGKISNGCYITNCGDFQVTRAGESEFEQADPHICADAQAQQEYLSQAADPLNQPQDEYEEPQIEVPEDSETSLAIEPTESGPIEQDYEFKMDQRRSNQDELIDRPDDIEINPRRQLRQILRDFAPLASARNSRFPFTAQPRPEKALLCQVKQPGELERQIVEETSEYEGDDEPEMSMFLNVCVHVPVEEISEYSENMEATALMGAQNPELSAEIQQMQLFERVNFCPDDFVGQTLAFMLPNEEKIGLCHADSIRMYTDHIFELFEHYTVRIGFRRIQTLPIPYVPLSDKRGKLVRIFACNKVENLSFAFPSQINVLHSKPLPVAVFASGELVATARTREYRANYQLLQRIVLTGWPYRIHRRKCICRFMLFNRDDVLYFRSANLAAGLSNGKILEPLGEKGYFKCFFDKEIQNGQVIEMKLYTEEPGLGLGMGIWGLDGCGYEKIFERIGEVYREWLERMYQDF